MLFVFILDVLNNNDNACFLCRDKEKKENYSGEQKKDKKNHHRI